MSYYHLDRGYHALGASTNDSNRSRRTLLRYGLSGTLMEVAITTPLTLQIYDRTSLIRLAENTSKSWISLK